MTAPMIAILDNDPSFLSLLHARHCPIVQKPFELHDLLTAIVAVLGPSPVQWKRGPHLHAVPSADPSVPDLADAPLVAAGEAV